MAGKWIIDQPKRVASKKFAVFVNFSQTSVKID
jgi:hypothetical protein